MIALFFILGSVVFIVLIIVRYAAMIKRIEQEEQKELEEAILKGPHVKEDGSFTFGGGSFKNGGGAGGEW